ncbi:MAG: hypothetical protein APF76_04600 [Desulfitibacter sp. BRH_c19]|nr:MAG: hypothetical protein APF76_04600 [Desulfitibacter sp. BRH_c19]
MEIVQFIGIITLITGAVVYVAKQIIKLVIDKDLEKFKNDLHIATLDHQIIYSRLHDDRAKVIKELYTKLVRMERIMNDLTGHANKEKANEAINQILDAKYFFEENRVYFQKDLSELIEEIVKTTHNNYFYASWNCEYQPHEIDSNEIREQTIQKRLEGWESVKEKVPRLKDTLEKEFRMLLGVQ